MSIKFGLLTYPKLNIMDEIRTIKSLGFDYVEIGIELPEGAPEILMKKKNKVMKLVSEFSYPAIAHTAWWIDLGSGYEYIRQAWVEESKKCIDTAEALGLKLINFHFYSIGLVEDYKAYHRFIVNNIIRSLKEIVEYADSKGLTVMYENSPTKKSNVGFKEYKTIMDKVPKLKVHLDIPHAFVENGMDGIKEYLFSFKDRIAHIHLHDNDGTEDQHLPLGKGKIDFKLLVKWLHEIKYDKTITLEVFTSKEDAKDSMIKFKKML
ncbi:MAG: sugar phosphate isomerase/epimerase [Candidatus Aenigmarchaeota archaeon]|nr:sugar phosphate isomerase/epimerase [Candidatus Aenigmarchaeota archaeon]